MKCVIFNGLQYVSRPTVIYHFETCGGNGVFIYLFTYLFCIVSFLYSDTEKHLTFDALSMSLYFTWLNIYLQLHHKNSVLFTHYKIQ